MARMVVDLVPRLAHSIEARTRRMLTGEGRTRAAVLVPLVPVGDAVHLLFIRRAAPVNPSLAALIVDSRARGGVKLRALHGLAGRLLVARRR